MENKIVIFGGTGSVGELIVNKLRKNGVSVDVLSRQEKTSSKDLKYVKGDVLDKEVIDKIINKDDIVVIALGLNKKSEPDMMSKGTANIISAMHKKGAKRLICLSAHGVGESWKGTPAIFKLIVKCIKVLKSSYRDHEIQEVDIKKSDLDWTIVRPTRILKSKETGNYKVNPPAKESKNKISKYDVAQFIVKELTEDKYLKQTVMISE